MKDRLELKISPSDKAITQAQAKKYGLTKSGWKYHLIIKPSVFFPKFISRCNFAKFFVDCMYKTKDNQVLNAFMK